MQAFVYSGVGVIRYLDLPGRGLPLVCLHGLGCASTSDFPAMASAAALQDRRRVLIDLLGSGYSDRPAQGHAVLVRSEAAAGHHVWAGTLRAVSPLTVRRCAASLVRGGSAGWHEQLLALTLPRTVVFGEHSLPDPDWDALPHHGVAVAAGCG